MTKTKKKERKKLAFVLCFPNDARIHQILCVVTRVFILRTQEMWEYLQDILHFLFSEPHVWGAEQGQQKGQTESAVSSKHVRLLIFAQEACLSLTQVDRVMVKSSWY